MSWSGFKKNVGRATTQVMMKTGHVEKTSDREYEIEERRYRTLESASLRLQKEAKGYLDSLRAMTASQMRIAETIDAFYGDSGATDGVSRSYKQAVEDLDAETVKALDGPYRTTVLDPINRFCAYFPDINECIKKRNHKMIDYDAMRSKVKKLTEKPDKDPSKLPRTEKETEMVGDPSSFRDLSTEHLNYLDDDKSLMVYSPPKALDGIQHHRQRLATLNNDEKLAMESVGAPTSPQTKRKLSLLKRISSASDAFWGRADAQKRITVAGDLCQAPLSPLAVSRVFSLPSQRSPITLLPDVDETSPDFLPVTSPVMMGGGLIPAISPHSTHAPLSQMSSDSTPARSTSRRAFSVFRRSSKEETPTRKTSMPVELSSGSSGDGLGISGCGSPHHFPMFRPFPDATPTRTSAMPGSMTKKRPLLGSPSSLLDTPTRLHNTSVRSNAQALEATPSRSVPPRFMAFSAASSDADDETIRSSAASWQTTYSEASEDERRDSMDPYSKHSDAIPLATLTSQHNDRDSFTVQERSSVDVTAETDYGESIADMDGASFVEQEHDDRSADTDEGDITLVDSIEEARHSSDTFNTTDDPADSSMSEIDTLIEEMSTPNLRSRTMEPRDEGSRERRDTMSLIAFLKEGPPGSAKKPERKFKPPPPVTLPPLFGRPYSAASARPEPLFSPPRSTGPFFQPSELEDIMQPLKKKFAEEQADLLQKAKVAYDQLNEQLTNELPQLIDLRVPYLDPSFEALVKIQLRFCAEAYSRMAQVQQYLAAETRDQYANGDLDARVEDVLGQIRELSIAGTV